MVYKIFFQIINPYSNLKIPIFFKLYLSIFKNAQSKLILVDVIFKSAFFFYLILLVLEIKDRQEIHTRFISEISPKLENFFFYFWHSN